MKRVTIYIDDSSDSIDTKKESPFKTAWDMLLGAGHVPKTNIYKGPWRYVYESVVDDAVPLIENVFAGNPRYRLEVEELTEEGQLV